MGTTYLHQEPGYSVTEEQWGEDNPGLAGSPWNWTITTDSPTFITWYMYSEDGRAITNITSGSPGPSYQLDWANYVGPYVAGQRPKWTRIVVDSTTATPALDAEWDQANTGDNLSNDPLSVVYWNLADPSGGRGTYPDGTTMGYCRDLSGFENTARATYGHTYLESTNSGVTLVLADDAVHFPASRNWVSPLLDTPAAWTLLVEAKFAAGGQETSIVGSAGASGKSNIYLALDATDHVVAKTANDAGSVFVATSTATIDPTVWHDYRVSRDASSLTVQVDGTEVATILCTGTPPVDSQALAMNATASPGVVRESWFRSVKLFAEADHYEPGRISLAPSPGGLLTATASPRGRVKLGLSVSPDGGPP